MERLREKVALVTGAARGLGAAIAARFAEEGARVVLSDVRDDLGAETAAILSTRGQSARYVHLNIADPGGWERTISEIEETEGRLDILVNNGGINLRKGIAEVSLTEWNEVISINLTGTMLGIKAATPLMRRAGSGSIINVSSISGLGASPNVAYGTSKWGLRGLTRSAAFEFGSDGIRVNAILPGVVDTELNTGINYMDHFRAATPMGKLTSAEDIAAMALFLASDESRCITGQDHIVDGGFSAGHRPNVQFKART